MATSPLVRPMLARGLFRRDGVKSVVYSAAGGALPGLFLSFTLFDMRTDLEVFVLQSAEEEGFDVRNSLPLCTADGWDSVFRNEGFHKEKSSGAELLRERNEK